MLWCSHQVASSVPEGEDTLIQVKYVGKDDMETAHKAVTACTRACTLISKANPGVNRASDLGVGTMHGSGTHHRQDGYLANYARRQGSKKHPALLDRKRKRGGQRDQASARALANKSLQIFAMVSALADTHFHCAYTLNHT